MIGVPAGHAQSAVTVTTTADEYDVAPNGSCSLREAIVSANGEGDFGGCTLAGVGGPYTITVAADTYTLTLAGAGEDLGATGDLDVTRDVIITPVAGGTATIDGGGLDRVFDLHAVSSLTVENLVIRNGSVVGQGAGLRVITASFTATGCVIEDNQATTDGGGIFADTGVTISITQCEIRNNAADVDGNGSNRGGAMYIADPGAGNVNTVNITASTLAGNNGDSFGGAISTLGTTTTTVTITNSTISGNTTGLSGGGLSLGGPTFLDAVTIVGNTSNTTSATGGGGGIRNVNGVLTMKNTIVAGNESTLSDCDDVSISAGSAVSQAANLIGENTCVTAAFPAGAPNANGDWVGVDATPIDPFLGPLADNGGPTRTHAVLAGSLAINNGNTALPEDQRGALRDGTPDIGSFEFGVTTAESPGPAGGETHAFGELTPNPTVAEAGFTLSLATGQSVEIALFDVAGRRIAMLHDAALPPGIVHNFVVDASSLSAGVYVLRIRGELFEEARRLVVRR
jgi:CSLREA domain-containing protein